MSNRKFGSFVNATTGNSASCYYNSELKEFSVVFFKAGVKQVDADYFTDDKQDAIDTAQHFINSTKW